MNGYCQPPIFSAALAVEQSVLERAARTAEAFQHACTSVCALSQQDEELRARLFLPFQKCPTLAASIAARPFFMDFFRLDFYVDAVSGALGIIEVNASPGAFPEHHSLDVFWSSRCDCSVPAGFKKAHPRDALQAFIRYLKKLNVTPRTMGLIVRDDGHYHPLAEARAYAELLRSETDIIPVFCTIDGGTKLQLWEDEPQPIASVDDLDVLYHNPGGTMQQRDAFTAWLQEREIVLVPPRFSLLFTNKSFLATLSMSLDRLSDLSQEERTLLKDAMIPCFPLCEWERHINEMQTWEGVVVKRDLGSSGDYVSLFPFATHSFSQVTDALGAIHRESIESGMTWTVQALRRPSQVLAHGQQYNFDIMVYTVMTPEPAVLFSTRPFSNGKANIAQGAWYGHMTQLQ